MYQYIKQVWLAGCLALAFVQTRAWCSWDGRCCSRSCCSTMRSSCMNALARSSRRMLGICRRCSACARLISGRSSWPPAIGCVALAMVAITFRRGGNEARQLSADLMCLLVALALFGVFFDMLHTITYLQRAVHREGVFADRRRRRNAGGQCDHRLRVRPHQQRRSPAPRRVGPGARRVVQRLKRPGARGRGSRGASRPCRTSAPACRRGVSIRACVTFR